MAEGGSVASKSLKPAIFSAMDTDKVGCFAGIGARMPGVHVPKFSSLNFACGPRTPFRKGFVCVQYSTGPLIRKLPTRKSG